MTDYESVFSFLGIREQDKQNYLMSALRPGLACVKDPRYGGAFTIKVPLVPIDKNVSDEMVEERLVENAHILKVEPRVTVAEMSQHSVAEQMSTEPIDEVTTETTGRTKANEHQEQKVPNGVKEMLWDTHANEDDGVATRYARLGLSASAGDRLRRKLEREGLVVTHRMNLAGRGGQTVLMELTDKAYGLLRIERPKERGIGDFPHRFLQRAIKAKLEGAGHVCTIEGQLPNGKSVDVLATDQQGRLLGIEVEMRHSPHVEINVRKDFEGGVGKLLIVAPDMHVMRAIKGELGNLPEISEMMRNVEVMVISRLLRSEEL